MSCKKSCGQGRFLCIMANFLWKEKKKFKGATGLIGSYRVYVSRDSLNLNSKVKIGEKKHEYICPIGSYKVNVMMTYQSLVTFITILTIRVTIIRVNIIGVTMSHTSFIYLSIFFECGTSKELPSLPSPLGPAPSYSSWLPLI